VIALWWIGEDEVDEAAVDRVRRDLAHQFEQPVVRWRGHGRPTGTLDLKRGQHSSREVLKWLVGERPPGAARVIGLTDVDLFIPVLTFVFGEAQLGGPAAVVSTARLIDPISPARTLERVSKECVHELAHTFGLVHCSTPLCVMTRSTSVQAVDGKRGALCDDCRDRYAARPGP
jgi:archaemetzincin